MTKFFKSDAKRWFIQSDIYNGSIDYDLVPLLAKEVNKTMYLGVVEDSIQYFGNSVDAIEKQINPFETVELYKQIFSGENDSRIFQSQGWLSHENFANKADSLEAAILELKKELGLVAKEDYTSSNYLLKKINQTLNEVTGLTNILDSSYIANLSEFLNRHNWLYISEDKIEILFSDLNEELKTLLSVEEITPTVRNEVSNASLELVSNIREQLREQEDFDILSEVQMGDKKTILGLGIIGCALLGESLEKSYKAVSNSVKKKLIVNLNKGISTDKIVSALEKSLPMSVKSRTYNALNLMIHDVVTKSRSVGLLQSYREAGILQCFFNAVMDHRTTETCAFLDGKLIGVEKAYNYYNEMTNQELDPKEAFPWVKEKVTDDVVDIKLPINGVEKTIASGQKGNISWNKGFSSEGVSENLIPPLHAYCRSTLSYESI